MTALQMDIKIYGIPAEIMKTALEQAKQGRLHILNEMNKALSSTRDEMSDFAQRIITFKIDPSKIREVIGKGGATILPGKDRLVHISQISDEHVDKVSDRLNEGDIVRVKVLEIDRQGRVRLSIKEVEKEEE